MKKKLYILIFLLLLNSCSWFHNSKPNTYPFSQKKLNYIVKKYLHTPYKYGHQSNSAMDCSAFTQTVYAELGYHIPRTVKKQFKIGIIVKKKDKIIPGDLVFFDLSWFKRVSHVGIYMGNFKFAHASKRKGVVISSLHNEYFEKRYCGARHITNLK